MLQFIRWKNRGMLTVTLASRSVLRSLPCLPRLQTFVSTPVVTQSTLFLEYARLAPCRAQVHCPSRATAPYSLRHSQSLARWAQFWTSSLVYKGLCCIYAAFRMFLLPPVALDVCSPYHVFHFALDFTIKLCHTIHPRRPCAQPRATYSNLVIFFFWHRCSSFTTPRGLSPPASSLFLHFFPF